MQHDYILIFKYQKNEELKIIKYVCFFTHIHYKYANLKKKFFIKIQF